MGGKQTGSWKYIYVYLAGLILLTFSGCALCREFHDNLKAHTYMSSAEKSLEKGDYKEATQKSQKSLGLAGKKSPGDRALFTLGLVHAHYGTADNYKKSLGYFKKLVSEHPKSHLAEESNIWIDILQLLEKTKGYQNIRDEKMGTFIVHAEELLSRDDYEGAIAESKKILDTSKGKSPEDEALFVLGLVYSHYGNAKRDYEKSLGYFQKLVSNYPESFLVQRAKIWIGVLEVIEKMKQVDIEMEKKKKEWTK